MLELVSEGDTMVARRKPVDRKGGNLARSLQYVKDGHYGKAIHALNSTGIALTDDAAALNELRK